jgi:hypothetical protein
MIAFPANLSYNNSIENQTKETQVKVRIYNPMWEYRHSYFFEVSEFDEYEGEEIEVKWLTEGQMALSTNNKNLAFRVLEREHIREIDGKPYEFQDKPKKDDIRLVRGSKGQVYKVTGNYRCTCPGFQFRSTCKHLKEGVPLDKKED